MQRSQCYLIFGPPAVGKMTVGQELARRTGFKLFHNHLIIEPLLNVFDFQHPSFKKLVKEMRERVFEEVVRSQLPGLIFTCVYDFDSQDDVALFWHRVRFFENAGWDVRLVELQAPLEERLKRNVTENRLAQKPSKRDLVFSEENVRQMEHTWRMKPRGDEIKHPHYFRCDNEKLSPQETVEKILQHFGRT